MRKLLSDASRSAVRAFAGAFTALVLGILAAPDLAQQKALAFAALIAGVTAALGALQSYVPQLSIAALLTRAVGGWNASLEKIEDSFVRAFIGTFITLSIGLLAAPQLDLSKAALIGLAVGALTAGYRAVQAALTKGEVPLPKLGA